MLDDVLGNYLDSLSEREFDIPFMSLLRSLGFYDIHFLHGQFEFGKDFIGKLREQDVVYQFAFQTKAGDLNLGAWNEVRGQIDLLRTSVLAHPNFDGLLPRRPVLVTTGRLTGGAPLAAQDYRAHLQQLREGSFEIWDREKLIELIGNRPETGLAGAATGELLATLGAIETSQIDDYGLERLSRRWCDESAPIERATIEAALLANRLRIKNRLDLACYTCLCLLRGMRCRIHGSTTCVNSVIVAAPRRMFRHYAETLWRLCMPSTLEPENLLNGLRMPPLFVTYPVFCCRLMEMLSLLAILVQDDEPGLTRQIAEYVEKFWANHPASAHPISDRWAVSLLPPSMLLAICNRRQCVTDYMKRTTKWIADHYDGDGFGLAASGATPKEEIDYLLGAPFEHVPLSRRKESYLSTIVLDVVSLIEDRELYDLVRNEFLAVEINSCLIEAPESKAQFLMESPELTFEANVPYADKWEPQDGWCTAPHHVRAKTQSSPSGRIAHWDKQAVSIVLRDRHFVGACKELMRNSLAREV